MFCSDIFGSCWSGSFISVSSPSQLIFWCSLNCQFRLWLNKQLGHLHYPNSEICSSVAWIRSEKIGSPGGWDVFLRWPSKLHLHLYFVSPGFASRWATWSPELRLLVWQRSIQNLQQTPKIWDCDEPRCSFQLGLQLGWLTHGAPTLLLALEVGNI